MQLVTWNLHNGDGRQVWPRLQAELAADIVFLQEADEAPEGAGVTWQKVPGCTWGSAVVTTLGPIRPIALPGYDGWVVGGEVEGSDYRLSVFSVHAPSTKKSAPREPYAAEVIRIIDLIHQAVTPGSTLIIGGDFNITLGERHVTESRQTSDAERRALKAIAAAGLVSCWMASRPGEPLAQTLRWSGDPSPGKTTPYHCDGILVPTAWSRSLNCVIHTDECFQVSDHNPVSATVMFTPRSSVLP